MFHGAGVLAPQFVVRDPPVLRCAFAVLGQFGFGVDRALRVVVFHPADAAQVSYVHVQPLEGDACGDDAVQFVGPYLGVEQAVAQGWAVEDLSLARCDGCVALYCRKVAPQGSGSVVWPGRWHLGMLFLGCLLVHFLRGMPHASAAGS